ncbi:hypothetical protein RCL1_005967 [Eukaryota sp. TZLM3-RCL]
MSNINPFTSGTVITDPHGQACLDVPPTPGVSDSQSHISSSSGDPSSQLGSTIQPRASDSQSRSSEDLSMSELGISFANPLKEPRRGPTTLENLPRGFKRLLVGNEPPYEDAHLIAVPSAWLLSLFETQETVGDLDPLFDQLENKESPAPPPALLVEALPSGSAQVSLPTVERHSPSLEDSTAILGERKASKTSLSSQKETLSHVMLLFPTLPAEEYITFIRQFAIWSDLVNSKIVFSGNIPTFGDPVHDMGIARAFIREVDPRGIIEFIDLKLIDVWKFSGVIPFS